MEGRGALRLGLCLLILMAGCKTQVWNVPNSNPGPLGSAPPPVPAPDQVKKANDKPKDLPALVLVSAGDWKVLEAFAPGTPPDRQQDVCELARADYQKALKQDPQCVPAYHGLARLYSGMHDFPLAIENYQKALKLAPKNAALWYELGVCHNYRRNWGPALECLNRATQLDPGNRSFFNTQGVVLAAAGRYEESLNCFVRSNGDAMGYYRLAQTLQHLQQPELSKRFLEVAVQKDPSLANKIAMQPTIEEYASATPATIQQTAYHPPSAPQEQAPPANLPQAASPEMAPSLPQPGKQAVTLPSPPSIHEETEMPNP